MVVSIQKAKRGLGFIIKMADKIICANCNSLVLKEKTRIIKGIPICLTCLEYNNINFEALTELARYFNLADKENEALLKCATAI